MSPAGKINSTSNLPTANTTVLAAFYSAYGLKNVLLAEEEKTSNNPDIWTMPESTDGIFRSTAFYFYNPVLDRRTTVLYLKICGDCASR